MAVDTDFEKESAKQVEKEPDTTAQLEVIVPQSDTLVLKDLEGVEHKFKKQTFPTYKTAQVLQMLAGVKDDIDLPTLIGEIQDLSRPTANDDITGQAVKLNAALNAIPKLVEIAPDLLLEFAALAIIPNKDLRAAHENDTLRDLRRDNRNKIEFEFTANAPIEIFAAYLPYLGVDFLATALASLNRSVGTTLSQLSQARPTG